MKIQIPYNYTPRPYQRNLYNAIANGYKRGLAVWHRRAGKDKTFINLIVKEAFKRVGVYYYFFPTYNQGRKILWDGIDKNGFPFLGHIPEAIRKATNSAEMKITLVNGSIFQIIGTDNIDCYDDKTEILTDEGWKLFKDIENNETVATLDNGEMKYVKIQNRIEHDYTGDMVRYLNKSSDLLTTPNHKYWVKSRKAGYRFVIAQELLKCPDNYMTPSINIWDGIDAKEFILPGVKVQYSCGKGRIVDEEHTQTFSSKDWAAFLGIYLSEGSTYNAGKGNYRVYITQNDGETSNEISELLKRMGLAYSRDNKNYIINHKSLYCYCEQFGKCHKKYIPKEIKTWSTELLKILLDWLIKGDGSITSTGQRVYFSTSKKLIDDVQEIIQKCGYSGKVVEKKQKPSYIRGRLINNFKTMYAISIRTSKYHHFTNTKTGSYLSIEKYNGKVYCVEVPSHVIMVRRNGKPIWCGNSIVGTNPVGCVFSEFSLQNPKAWEFIRPILAENEGWAFFNFTPRGHNHGYELSEMARNNPEWFHEILTIDDTGAITKEQIQAERRSGMPEDLINQEFYCSFEASIVGAYFANEMRWATEQGRITRVPISQGVPVNVYCDIGIDDSFTLWLVQNAFREYHFVDCYSNSGEAILHYANWLKDWRGPNQATIGMVYFPHDGNTRSVQTGKTPQQLMREYGFETEIIARPQVKKNGIEASRQAFANCYFDEKRCAKGIDALRQYHKEYDDDNGVFKTMPVHDWTSHYADGFQTFALWKQRQLAELGADEEDDDTIIRGENRSRVTGY